MNTTQIKAELDTALKELAQAKKSVLPASFTRQDIFRAEAAIERAAALLDEPIIAMPAGTLCSILDLVANATDQAPIDMIYTVPPEVAAWLRGILSASGNIDGSEKSWALHELKPRKETK